jgi:hypothetical protein
MWDSEFKLQYCQKKSFKVPKTLCCCGFYPLLFAVVESRAEGMGLNIVLKNSCPSHNVTFWELGSLQIKLVRMQMYWGGASPPSNVTGVLTRKTQWHRGTLVGQANVAAMRLQAQDHPWLPATAKTHDRDGAEALRTWEGAGPPDTWTSKTEWPNVGAVSHQTLGC